MQKPDRWWESGPIKSVMGNQQKDIAGPSIKGFTGAGADGVVQPERRVPGMGNGSYDAHESEYIHDANATQAIGPDLLQAMDQAAVQGNLDVNALRQAIGQAPKPQMFVGGLVNAATQAVQSGTNQDNNSRIVNPITRNIAGKYSDKIKSIVNPVAKPKPAEANAKSIVNPIAAPKPAEVKIGPTDSGNNVGGVNVFGSIAKKGRDILKNYSMDDINDAIKKNIEPVVDTDNLDGVTVDRASDGDEGESAYRRQGMDWLSDTAKGENASIQSAIDRQTGRQGLASGAREDAMRQELAQRGMSDQAIDTAMKSAHADSQSAMADLRSQLGAETLRMQEAAAGNLATQGMAGQQYEDSKQWDDFLRAAEYGDDDAVAQAYENYFGEPLTDSAYVTEIRDYAQKKREADLQSTRLGVDSQAFNLGYDMMQKGASVDTVAQNLIAGGMSEAQALDTAERIAGYHQYQKDLPTLAETHNFTEINARRKALGMPSIDFTETENYIKAGKHQTAAKTIMGIIDTLGPDADPAMVSALSKMWMGETSKALELSTGAGIPSGVFEDQIGTKVDSGEYQGYTFSGAEGDTFTFATPTGEEKVFSKEDLNSNEGLRNAVMPSFLRDPDDTPLYENPYLVKLAENVTADLGFYDNTTAGQSMMNQLENNSYFKGLMEKAKAGDDDAWDTIGTILVQGKMLSNNPASAESWDSKNKNLMSKVGIYQPEGGNAYNVLKDNFGRIDKIKVDPKRMSALASMLYSGDEEVLEHVVSGDDMHLDNRGLIAKDGELGDGYYDLAEENKGKILRGPSGAFYMIEGGTKVGIHLRQILPDGTLQTDIYLNNHKEYIDGPHDDFRYWSQL